MKRFALPSAFLAAFLAACAPDAFAQDTPPPPAEPPKDPPVEPAEPQGLVWETSWEKARNKGNALNGYALLWVTHDKTKDGKDAEATERLLNGCWGVPQINQRMTPLFGCFKGTFAECQQGGAGEALAAAKVTEGPAVIIIDPSNGALVDQLLGSANFMEILDLVDKIDRGFSRLGCEAKLGNKDNAEDPELNLSYAQAMVRAEDTKVARKHFQKVVTAQNMKQKTYARIGLALCDLKDGKHKEAIEAAAKIFDDLPVEAADPRAQCLYIMTWSYYLQKDLDDASKNAEMLLQRYIRTTWGWKLNDDQMDIGWDFVKKEKIERK